MKDNWIRVTEDTLPPREPHTAPGDVPTIGYSKEVLVAYWVAYATGGKWCQTVAQLKYEGDKPFCWVGCDPQYWQPTLPDPKPMTAPVLIVAGDRVTLRNNKLVYGTVEEILPKGKLAIVRVTLTRDFSAPGIRREYKRRDLRLFKGEL